jgi:hypothetical protein
MKKYILLLVIFALVLLFLLLFVNKKVIPKQIESLVFSNETLYLKKYTGEETICLSNNEKMYRGESKNIDNIIILGAFEIFYKKSSDSLFIMYLGERKSNSNLNTRIHIVEKTIDNIQYYDYRENYKRLGLEKFPK